jgi:hypothetical protein
MNRPAALYIQEGLQERYSLQETPPGLQYRYSSQESPPGLQETPGNVQETTPSLQGTPGRVQGNWPSLLGTPGSLQGWSPWWLQLHELLQAAANDINQLSSRERDELRSVSLLLLFVQQAEQQGLLQRDLAGSE